MNIYQIKVNDKLGNEYDLKQHQNQVMLIVNTASKCGLTPQFAELQELYDEFKDQGLIILGFPCSQFANQELDSATAANEFCQLNYGVTFPILEKLNVNGANTHELFKYLKEEQPGLLGKKIKWNFTKFLVDRDGNVVKRFAPKTKPHKIKADIKNLLK